MRVGVQQGHGQTGRPIPLDFMQHWGNSPTITHDPGQRRRLLEIQVFQKSGKIDVGIRKFFFVEKTRNESAIRYYGWSFNGEKVHCRQGYHKDPRVKP
jgi:hypothetical protein